MRENNDEVTRLKYLFHELNFDQIGVSCGWLSRLLNEGLFKLITYDANAVSVIFREFALLCIQFFPSWLYVVSWQGRNIVNIHSFRVILPRCLQMHVLDLREKSFDARCSPNPHINLCIFSHILIGIACSFHPPSCIIINSLELIYIISTNDIKRLALFHQ